MRRHLLLWITTLLLTPGILFAGDLTGPSYILRGATLNGGGGVGW